MERRIAGNATRASSMHGEKSRALNVLELDKATVRVSRPQRTSIEWRVSQPQGVAMTETELKLIAAAATSG